MFVRVDHRYIVKVADFGKCKELYDRNYYKESERDRLKLFKWMAIECLTEGVHSTSSDVVG